MKIKQYTLFIFIDYIIFHKKCFIILNILYNKA